MPILAALVALAQADQLDYKKYDRLCVALKVTTEISASDGRDSKYTMDLDVVWECAAADAKEIIFDGSTQSAAISGTVRGREYTYEWRKGGTAKTTGQKIAGVSSIESAYKLKIDPKGNVIECALEPFLDAFPVFSPSALIAMAGPLGSGKSWKGEPVRFPWYSGFSVAYDGSAGEPKDDLSSTSTKVKFAPPDTEVPIEGQIAVKGTGQAGGEFDVKKKRPTGKGSARLTLSSDQGGLKRAITQTVEWTVK